MGRPAFYDTNGLKRGAWSQAEDDKLRTFVEKHGHWNWRQLPKIAGLSRCGKSCRLRWMNYLRPNIKRGNFTREEEDTIMSLHNTLGNKWSLIAEKLPGRSDNEIKNYWHTRLKKRLNQNEMSTTPLKQELHTRELSEQERSDCSVDSKISNAILGAPASFDIMQSSTTVLEENPSSCLVSMASPSMTSLTMEYSVALWENFEEMSSFWTLPFVATADDTYCGDGADLMSQMIQELPESDIFDYSSSSN